MTSWEPGARPHVAPPLEYTKKCTSTYVYNIAHPADSANYGIFSCHRWSLSIIMMYRASATLIYVKNVIRIVRRRIFCRSHEICCSEINFTEKLQSL